jgi:choline-sulfatase
MTLNRRHFLKSTAAATSVSSLSAAQPKPNFLFLIADDLTFRAVHALGNPEIQTPNIDRLLQRGTHFTHCFHQGSWSGAVCVPSRTMLNSGLTTFRARKGFEQSPLWAETFAQAGYDTFLVGKWHLSDTALKRSFTQTGIVSGGMFESGPDAYNRPSPGNTWTPWDTTLNGQWLHRPQGQIRHSAALWVDGAIEHLQTKTAASKPFLMYVGFNSPHDPRQAPRDFVERYPMKKIQIPPSYLPEHPFDQGDNRVRDELLAPFPRTRAAVQLHRSEYYAHITYMDAQIGRLLAALESYPQAANTYIIFTADHGLAVGEHGLMGKQNLYDHSVRMPYVIVGPGIPKGKQIDTLVYQHSTFATTCDLAGVPTPRSVQFPSLVPLIHGQTTHLHDAVFCWYRDLQRSVRTEDHKLIVYPKAGITQLFDLKSDPWETTNLPDPATRALLLTRLHQFQRDLGDDVCAPV